MPILPIREDDHVNNPPSKINNRWYYPFVRINGGSIDLETSAEGRYKGYFASGKAEKSNHLFEFLVTHPIATITDGEKHAYGRYLIATLQAEEKSGSFSGGVARATVNVEGRRSTAKFNANTLGVDDASWEKLRKVAKTIDGSSIDSLGGAIEQVVSWCIAEAKEGKKPPTGVRLIRDVEWNLPESVSFALNRIKKGDSVKQANDFLNDKLSKAQTREEFQRIDPLTIAAVYHRLKIPIDQNPSPAHRNLANAIRRSPAELPSENNMIQGYWYELGPYRMQDGSVPSLNRLSPDSNKIKLSDWPISTSELSPSKGNVGSFNIDYQTALQVSSSSLVDVGINADGQFHGYGFTSDYIVNGQSGSIILDEKYTVGFIVRTRTSDFDASLDVPKLAAKASLGISDVSYEIESLGFNLAGLGFMSSFVASAIGKFDLTTLATLGSLYDQASTILNDHNNPNFLPILTSVKLNLGSPEIQLLVNSGLKGLHDLQLKPINVDLTSLDINGGQPELAGVMELGA